MRLIALFEAVEQSTIEWWTRYAAQRPFKSEEEARAFIRRKTQDSAWTIGQPDPEAYYNQLAAEMPLYQGRAGWFIGSPQIKRRVQQRSRRKANPPFSWKNITLIEPDFTELRSFGFLDSSDRITGPKMVSIADLTPTESGQDEEQISAIIQWIKEDGEFKPFVIEEGGAIADGHHRYEALKRMKVKRGPAYTIVRGS